MRTTGPQNFYSFPFSAGQVVNIPKPIPLNQPLAFLNVEFKGRIVIATANYTTVAAESLLNILMNLQLNGTHATLGNVTPFNMSGPNLFMAPRLWGVPLNSLYINGARVTSTASDLYGSATSPFSGTAVGSFGNTGTYDVMIHWTIPVFPYGVPDSQALLYCYNAAAWGQTLQLRLTAGDLTAFGTPGTATVTYSAYGSGTGTPVWNLAVTYISLGDFQNSVAQAVRVLNDVNVGSTLTSTGNLVRLALLQNQKTLAVITKTGAVQAATNGSIYTTLNDLMTDSTIIRLNNNPIRNLFLDSITRDFYGFRESTVQPTGYKGIFFDDGYPTNNAYTAIRGENFPGGAQFDVATNVLTAAGTNGGEVIQEYILGTPVVAGQ